MGSLLLSHKPNDEEDGFFLLLADPGFSAPAQASQPKNVIFALDVSGSRQGAKFKQAQDALIFILERLREQDNFNLVIYNDQVDAWRPELMNMSARNRLEAKKYVQNLRAGGMTNISGALEKSFQMASNSSIPDYIIFLADGQPTAGESRELPLAELAKKFNPNRKARLFVFGVGYDVNARLLDRLSGQAGGVSVFVAPDENLESKVANFFQKMDRLALTGPTLSWVDFMVNRVLPGELPDIFMGDQLVVVGRYPEAGKAGFLLEGKVGGHDQVFSYEAQFALPCSAAILSLACRLSAVLVK